MLVCLNWTRTAVKGGGFTFPSVQSIFRSFNQAFEGLVPYMYLDIRGLVTVGVGNLIDPVELAQALPFQFKNKPGTAGPPGSRATADQIAAEWQSLKDNPDLASAGFRACASLTQLELSDESIDALILSRLTSNADYLKRQLWFHSFETWPADAQLGLLSMAWAMGPGGPGQFPKFRAACQRLDFNAAAAECQMDASENLGLVPRNRANVTLFSNAAVVEAGATEGSFQLSVLYYPRTLKADNT
jgi:GH24 family phage-related lysozyme (muramidase)